MHIFQCFVIRLGQGNKRGLKICQNLSDLIAFPLKRHYCGLCWRQTRVKVASGIVPRSLRVKEGQEPQHQQTSLTEISQQAEALGWMAVMLWKPQLSGAALQKPDLFVCIVALSESLCPLEVVGPFLVVLAAQPTSLLRTTQRSSCPPCPQ